MSDSEKKIPKSIKYSPEILGLKHNLYVEGEARRRQKFHEYVMRGLSQSQINKKLDKFDDAWIDHEDEVINAMCEEMLAMADFAKERLKGLDEKFGKGKGKKKEDD